MRNASENSHGGISPKEYLSQMWKLRVLIEQRERQLESLNSNKFSSHIEYGKTPSGNRPTGAPFESIAIRAVDLSAEIARMIEEYNRLKNSIIGMIHEDHDNTPEDGNDHMINSVQYAFIPYKGKISVSR